VEELDDTNDLVLAPAQDYDWENVGPFVESLRRTGFRGEIRLFGPGMSDAAVRRLRAESVEVSRPFRIRVKAGGSLFHPYNPKTTRVRWHVQPFYRDLVRAASWLWPDRRAARRWLTGAISILDVARHFWYFAYLSEHASRYRNVMLSDVRDVLFLGNPFDFEIGDHVNCFLEHETYRLRDQVNNRGWLVGGFGQSALDELGDRPISCAGVTIGTSSAVLGYLATTTRQLVELRRQFNGMDQGVHNYLLHKGLVPDARLLGNEDGPVLTVGLMEHEEAEELVRRRAHEAKVVHQYDRHPGLADTIQSLARTAQQPF
jgi:hypothetical protein